MKNFIPNPKGPIQHRPGMKQIAWGRKTFWVRLKMWWNGDPTQVNQVLVHNEQLFAATDRGLYIMHGDVLKPVPFLVEVNHGS